MQYIKTKNEGTPLENWKKINKLTFYKEKFTQNCNSISNFLSIYLISNAWST